MRRYLIFAAILAFLNVCSTDTSAQCSKSCKDCHKKKETASKSLTCKLTSAELRKRKEDVISKLAKQVLTKKELADGYSFKFKGTDEMLDAITAFIKSERQCCDFFSFKVSVTNNSFIWLDIVGPKGAKEFITTELQM